MPCADCGLCREQWKAGVKQGAALPVAMVCNLAGVTDINDVELIAECFQETDDCDSIWTRTTVLTYIAGVQQAPTFIWSDPDGNVSATAPGVAVEKCKDCETIPVQKGCYLRPEFLVDISANTWIIDSPTQAHVDIPIGATGDTIRFSISRVTGPATVSDTLTCIPPSPDTNAYFSGAGGNTQWQISWNRDIVGPFSLDIYDIDVGETVSVVSTVPEDSTINYPSAASAQWSTFVWDDADLLNRSVTLEISPFCVGFGVRGTFTIPEECRKAWVFVDCDQTFTYRDIVTDSIITDPEKVNCDDVRCQPIYPTYVSEIGCYYAPTVGLPSPPNAPTPAFFNDFPADGAALWEYSPDSGANWSSPAPLAVYHDPPGIAAGVNRWRTTFTIPDNTYQGTWDIITSGDMYDTGEPFEGELWLNGVLIGTTDHAAGSTTTIPVAPGTYTLEWREAESTIEGNTVPNIVASYTNTTILPTSTVGGINVEAIKEISEYGEILSVTLYDGDGNVITRVADDVYTPGPCGLGVSTPIECPKVVGPLCYETDVEGCETVWANDYGAWQGGSGINDVVSTQETCDGQTINLSWGGFVDGEIVNSASAGDSISVLASGGPTTRQFTLDWDIDLTGPFAFIVSNISPGDEDVPTITPTPDSITPDFTVGDANTLHQVYYNDITDINQITIEFELITFPTGTVVVSMDESVPFTVLEPGLRDAYGLIDTCADPPITTYYDLQTGVALTSEEIATIQRCVSEDDCNNPGPKLCYDTGDTTLGPVVEVSLTDAVWSVDSPTSATLTVDIPGTDDTLILTATALGTTQFGSGGGAPAYVGNGLSMQTADSFSLTWNLDIEAGTPLDIGIWDIDGALNIFNPVPDNAPAIGDNTLSVFTWNDGGAINKATGVTINLAAGDADGISLVMGDATMTPITVQSEIPIIGEVISFFDCDGVLQEYRDTVTDAVVADPNIVPCEQNDCDNPSWTRDCIVTWSEVLCDRVDIVQGLDLFTFAEPGQEVQKLNGLTGAVEDSHSPIPGIDWGHGTVYDGENNLYYLYDNNSGDWHRYDGSNLAAGSTNLGVFGGDPIVGTLTFGAFDVTSGWGYVGTTGTRYRIDFDALVVTSLPAHTTDGVTNIVQLSSLSITDQGIHYLTSITGSITIWYSVDVITGISTLIGNEPIVLNGADFDIDTLTGFYGAGQGNLHRWTQPDGSDFQIISTAPSTGSLAVGNASVVTNRTEFQRVYHKNIVTGEIDIQDHDLEGGDYEVMGVAESCPQEFELPCPTKSVTEVCYETERLIDAEITLHGGAWTIVGPNQATQTFELPDGSNVNFTLTRAVGGSEVSPGPVINGIETLNLTTPTNGPSTWGLVWDVPLTGRFTMLFDDFDNDGGVTINEQLGVIGPQAPDNAGDYQGNILNERITFVWDTSLIGGTNVTFQINNAGVQIADSINIAPITMTVPVEFVGAYSALASMDCNDIVTYYDANTLDVLEDPAIVPCESLKVHWMEQLCDRIDTITGLDLFFFNDANQEVQRVNAFSGAVEDSHAPNPAIDWGHGTVFDASGGATGYYYLYDNTASEWHRYEAGNISAGSVNLGPFGGDPIVGSLTFGAFDPTTGLGYVGFVEQTRYEVDFNTATITALPGFTGFTGAPSSLSVTETGLHYMTGLLAGAHTILHTVDVATGVCTPTGNFINIGLNGADYDQDTLSGFYGIGNNNLYHWTELNGSDLETLTPAVFSGTLAVGNTVVSTERIEFQRVYHKDLVSGEVTRQDHDLEGADYEIQGVVERCQPSCDDPLYVQQCIETWSKLLRDENCVVFNRVYHKTLEGVVTYQDHDLSGNLYTPVGEVGVGINCYDVESHIVEIVSGGTWTPASVPANHVLTGLSMNVIIEAVNSSVTDADGNIITNIPAGLSMSWNVSQDYNTLVPPQSISAGTDGRMILNMTVRDET